MTNIPLKVILTGPESSGKTTLAKQLAYTLETGLTPEFSRACLLHLGRPYRYEDLAWILAGQQAWETWHERNSKNGLLVCDTDWTVIRVWELFRFNRIDHTRNKEIDSNTCYLLCSPDIPFESDQLRENPGERDQLFALYHALLVEKKARFVILEGNRDERFDKALGIIRKLC